MGKPSRSGAWPGSQLISGHVRPTFADDLHAGSLASYLILKVATGTDVTDRTIDDLTIDELARAARLVTDLANSGVCDPEEMRQLWVIADRIDAAVLAKRETSR